MILQEDSRVILAQKYADGGDLLKALHHAGGRLTEHSAVSMVIHPLLSCMMYLHGKGIIHRYVTPQTYDCFNFITLQALHAVKGTVQRQSTEHQCVQAFPIKVLPNRIAAQ
jgi:hypothetical protein